MKEVIKTDYFFIHQLLTYNNDVGPMLLILREKFSLDQDSNLGLQICALIFRLCHPNKSLKQVRTLAYRAGDPGSNPNLVRIFVLILTILNL